MTPKRKTLHRSGWVKVDPACPTLPSWPENIPRTITKALSLALMLMGAPISKRINLINMFSFAIGFFSLNFGKKLSLYASVII